MSVKNNRNMHTDEIAVINDRHSRSVDLTFMWEYGMYSKLLGYDNLVIKMEIYVSAIWKLKPQDTARFYASLFRRSHPELADALAFDARLIFETELADDDERDWDVDSRRKEHVRKFRYYNKENEQIAAMPDEQVMVLMAYSRLLVPDTIKEKLTSRQLVGLIDN